MFNFGRLPILVETETGTYHFRILNIELAEKYEEDRAHVVISILSPGSNIKLPDNLKRRALLSLQFHDFNDPKLDGREVRNEEGKLIDTLHCFTAKEAQEVVDCIQEWRDKVSVFIIHCEAGISRSAGIGAAIAKILGGDDTPFFKQYVPNSLVYNSILACYYRDSIYEEQLKDYSYTYKRRNELITERIRRPIKFTGDSNGRFGMG